MKGKYNSKQFSFFVQYDPAMPKNNEEYSKAFSNVDGFISH